MVRNNFKKSDFFYLFIYKINDLQTSDYKRRQNEMNYIIHLENRRTKKKNMKHKAMGGGVAPGVEHKS